ncbi:MAG: DUF4190 domain-containing protein [Planctomycetota bacterium]|jgi:hypothetical protein
MGNQSTNSVSQKKTSRMAVASLGLAVVGWILLIVTCILAMFLNFDMTEVIHPYLIALMWLFSIAFGVGALVIVRSQGLRGTMFAIGGIVSSILPLVCGVLLALTMFPKEITKVSKYSKIRHAPWHKPELVAHFPEKLPDDAKDVSLSAFPGFLQGGAWFQVKMSLPQDRIDQLFHEFDLKKIKSFQGGGWSDHANSEGGVPTTFFRTGESDYGDFPDDFTIMVLGAKDEGAWNHGSTYGVAISKLRNEIVYWADDW